MSTCDPLTVSRGEAFLFLDDTQLADVCRATRVWHQANKMPEPVLRGDQAWERGGVAAYGSVLRWRGRFHMWYSNWLRSPDLMPGVCYAVSDDGINWTKPRLGLVEALGCRENNLVLRAQGEGSLIDDITVFEDVDDEQWPLKALFWDNTRLAGDVWGIWAARSADGVHWERIGLVLPGWGDRFNAVGGKVDGKYIVLGRAGRILPCDKGRSVFRTESDDLVNWSPPKLVLYSDLEDPAEMEIYSNVGFRYEGLLMSGIERMHMTPDMVDTEIGWSHDAGHTWQRSRQRQVFIPWSPPRAWDDTWVSLTANDPILQGSQLWFYYSGRSGAHGEAFPHNFSGIGLATLRRDGFCSVRTTEMEGYVVTRPLIWPGGELMVNYDPRRDIRSHHGRVDTGLLKVEVRDERGRPVEHFTADNCQPLRTNTVNLPGCRQPVRWGDGDGRSLEELAGREVQLVFRSRDTHLYSFAAEDKDASLP